MRLTKIYPMLIKNVQRNAETGVYLNYLTLTKVICSSKCRSDKVNFYRRDFLLFVCAFIVTTGQNESGL